MVLPSPASSPWASRGYFPLISLGCILFFSYYNNSLISGVSTVLPVGEWGGKLYILVDTWIFEASLFPQQELILYTFLAAVNPSIR